jgi:2,3,4,5-tetrahydropyridine-2-carboxylate N-succinyltransferase
VVLMPSFVNIGAHVGAGTMVDTWATVGSCAQVGARVHISGGAGIGGVLEPLQASAPPSSRTTASSARVRKWWKAWWWSKGSVIGMGVFLGQSTRIYDRATAKSATAACPPAAWWCQARCLPPTAATACTAAVIVKQVDAKTRSKTSINDLLRGAAE